MKNKTIGGRTSFLYNFDMREHHFCRTSQAAFQVRFEGLSQSLALFQAFQLYKAATSSIANGAGQSCKFCREAAFFTADFCLA